MILFNETLSDLNTKVTRLIPSFFQVLESLKKTHSQENSLLNASKRKSRKDNILPHKTSSKMYPRFLKGEKSISIELRNSSYSENSFFTEFFLEERGLISAN